MTEKAELCRPDGQTSDHETTGIISNHDGNRSSHSELFTNTSEYVKIKILLFTQKYDRKS